MLSCLVIIGIHVGDWCTVGVMCIHPVIIILMYTAPPGPPRTLTVDSCDATSFLICWEAPLDSDSPISFYTISAHNLNNTSGMDDIVIRNTTNNSTLFNVTGLFPGTTYKLTVVAVSQGGDIIAKSQPSEPATHTTGLTGENHYNYYGYVTN